MSPRRSFTGRYMDIMEALRRLESAQPKLIEVGRPTPQLVVSFGGSGALVTYSLGVAQWLLENRGDLLNQWYFVGSGTGVLPAVALPLAVQKKEPHLLREISKYVVQQAPRHVFDEDLRRKYILDGLRKFVPEDAHCVLEGRVCLFAHINFEFIIGRTHEDLPNSSILYGNPLIKWDSSAELSQCMDAAMVPYRTHSIDFRGIPLLSATKYSLSSEVSSHLRHVYVHGYAGNAIRTSHTRHNYVFGRHGTLANTSVSFRRQFWANCFPGWSKQVLESSYHAGYRDASRYHRWEEDPYYRARGLSEVEFAEAIKN